MKGRSKNLPRNRVEGHLRPHKDYFDRTDPVFPKKMLRRWYRMSRDMFIVMPRGVTDYDPYSQCRPDATCALGMHWEWKSRSGDVYRWWEGAPVIAGGGEVWWWSAVAACGSGGRGDLGRVEVPVLVMVAGVGGLRWYRWWPTEGTARGWLEAPFFPGSTRVA